MKVRTRVVAAIGATTMAALVGVSAPAYASVHTQPKAAVSIPTISVPQWYIAAVYSNTRWGQLACTLAGAGMKAAGQVYDWHCTVDLQSGALFLWVYAEVR
jgi:hypothetical protein